jgi:hypothetical protein
MLLRDLIKKHGLLAMSCLAGLGETPNPDGHVYFVDKRSANAADANDGEHGQSWDMPYNTIAYAITRSNATIDWSANPWLVQNYILIGPGEYAEALTALPYSCVVIGTGILGTDTATEIHPAAAAGAAMAGTMLGLRLKNLRIEAESAGASAAIIDLGICNNSIIEDCEIFKGIVGTNIDYGIRTENCTNLQVRRCLFGHGATSPITDWMKIGGGANKYFHQCRVEKNHFNTFSNSAVNIADNCTASGSIIADNDIIAPAATYGIYEGSKVCTISNNRIIAVDAIKVRDDSVSYLVANSVVNNGIAAMEPVHAS